MGPPNTVTDCEKWKNRPTLSSLTFHPSKLKRAEKMLYYSYYKLLEMATVHITFVRT